jgi:hypothetical protein
MNENMFVKKMLSKSSLIRSLAENPEQEQTQEQIGQRMAAQRDAVLANLRQAGLSEQEALEAAWRKCLLRHSCLAAN